MQPSIRHQTGLADGCVVEDPGEHRNRHRCVTEADGCRERHRQPSPCLYWQEVW